MGLTRRRFLLNSVSAGVLLSLTNVFSFASEQKLTQADYARLCERWTDIITGRHLIDPTDQRYQNALAGLSQQAKTILADLDPSPNPQQVLLSTPLNTDKSPAITKTARAVTTLATAWATPGTDYFNDKFILQKTIQALSDFLRLRYHVGQTPYDNWWDWESGGARAVADVMCILHKHLPSDVMQAAQQAIVYFIPDPFYLRTTKAAGNSRQDTLTDDNRTLSTGANRIDLCRAAVCAAIASQDAERVRHALSGLADTWQIVQKGDGFYADGSFIQHYHTPYTGSYGDVLLTGLSMLFTLVSDTAFNIPIKQRQLVYDHIDKAYIPVIVAGQVLDNVRGRSVSRLTEPGSMHGGSIMKSILLLAQGAPADYQQKWQAICVNWIKRNQYNQFDKRGSITHLSLVINALQHSQGNAPLQPSKMFASMDRLVHRTPNWVASIAMCSRRISWYECGNQENEWASRTGSGMRYLYLLNQLSQFEDAFWPTLDYAAPTGTTVDTYPLSRKAAGEWGHNTPDNEWTGGLTKGTLSVAAMHLIGPDNNGLTARKIWLATEQAIIELVTDVKTSADYALTVVEHRNLGSQLSSQLNIDKHQLTQLGNQTFNQPKSASLSQVAYYQFLTPVELIAKLELRKGSWLDINPARKSAQAEQQLSRYWATMQVKHRENQGAAWVIYPNTDQAPANPHQVEIKQNDKHAQIITLDQQQQVWAIWQAGQYQHWLFTQPTLLLSQQQENHLLLTLVEPTQTADQLILEVAGKWQPRQDNVQYQHINNNTRLTFVTANLAGQSIDCELQPV